MTDLAGRRFHRILIIKPSSPGDIIHALPVLHGLRRRFPDAHLAWLVASPFANLIEADPAIDEVIPFDRKRFGRMWYNPVIRWQFAAFVGRLRRRRFDLVIDLQGLFRSGFLTRVSGAGVRIGFAAAREMAGMFYTHKIAAGDPNRHAADKNLDVARLLGFDDTPPDFSIHTTEDDRAHAARLLAEAGVLVKSDLRVPLAARCQCPHGRASRPWHPTLTSPETDAAEGDRYAVLVPVTRWETKCWPADRFGKLAKTIKQCHGLGTVLVGGSADIPAGDTAAAASEGTAANLCGKTTLRELAALIAGASIVVTADSTPMHMAAAAARPLVALFGPTNPARTGPYARTPDVLRVELNCSPCYLRHKRQCPHEHACMEELAVETVADAVSTRLSSVDG